MLLQVDLVLEADVAGRMVRQAVAIEARNRLDHLFGPVRLAGHHQRRQRIERVEQEVRIDLIAQRSQFRRLGRRAEAFAAPLGRACLRTGQQGKKQRRPGQQDEIASDREVEGHLPLVECGRGRRDKHALRNGLFGLLDIFAHLRAGQVDEEIAGIVAAQGNTALLAHLLLDLGFDRTEYPAVRLRDHDRTGHRDNQRDRDLDAERAVLDHPQDEPKKPGHGHADNADQCAPP